MTIAPIKLSPRRTHTPFFSAAQYLPACQVFHSLSPPPFKNLAPGGLCSLVGLVQKLFVPGIDLLFFDTCQCSISVCVCGCVCWTSGTGGGPNGAVDDADETIRACECGVVRAYTSSATQHVQTKKCCVHLRLVDRAGNTHSDNRPVGWTAGRRARLPQVKSERRRRCSVCGGPRDSLPHDAAVDVAPPTGGPILRG
jgi:hypothetical protein